VINLVVDGQAGREAIEGLVVGEPVLGRAFPLGVNVPLINDVERCPTGALDFGGSGNGDR